jgi:hypothetical protein
MVTIVCPVCLFSTIYNLDSLKAYRAMEELEKVPKELKGSATLELEQHYNQYPGIFDSSCICIKR